jgi:ATP-dependent DNA helicase PIF1
MNWILFFVLLCYLVYEADKKRFKTNADKFLSQTKIDKPTEESSKVSYKDQPFNLSEEQLRVFDYLESSLKHAFITGKAGSGKSALLNYFKSNTKKQVIVLAPTGIAALNVGGQTIHSFFKIKPGVAEATNIRLSQEALEILKHVDALIIDEISMVRADLIDALDGYLRKIRNTKSAFGGIQLVMFGDLYQLPPIMNDQALCDYFKLRYGGYFFFNARVWQQAELMTYELKKIFRQPGNKFKDILNSVRSGHVDEHLLSELNQRARVRLPDSGVITLGATNKIVEEINQQKLASINGKEFVYEAVIQGKVSSNDYLVEKTLKLKVGAQVMMIKNDKDKRWVNGSLGRVIKLSREEVIVRINSNDFIVTKCTWSKIRYNFNQTSGRIEESSISQITQFPLRLAWAMTIHKSQGQTYSSCAIDLKDGVFAHGQAYVALSRCKSLSGLYLLSPILASDISVDPQVTGFMNRAELLSI